MLHPKINGHHIDKSQAISWIWVACESLLRRSQRQAFFLFGKWSACELHQHWDHLHGSDSICCILPRPGQTLCCVQSVRTGTQGLSGCHMAQSGRDCCNLYSPACSLYSVACSLYSPACSVCSPACSLLVYIFKPNIDSQPTAYWHGHKWPMWMIVQVWLFSHLYHKEEEEKKVPC